MTDPIPGRRTRAPALPPSERRRAIVDATVGLLLGDTCEVTTRRIADAAGIAEGTLFRVFADKDDLMAAAVDAVMDTGPFEAALATLDVTRPLAELLTEAVHVVQERSRVLWRVLARVPTRVQDRARVPLPESPGLRRIFLAHRDEIVLEPAVAALRFRGMALAMTHPLMARKPASPAEIVQLFLHGAARRPSC